MLATHVYQPRALRSKYNEARMEKKIRKGGGDGLVGLVLRLGPKGFSISFSYFLSFSISISNLFPSMVPILYTCVANMYTS